MKHNLLKSVILSVILLMGVSKVWAYDQSAVDLYFDNSTAKWTNCYVYIGHGSYTSCYAMTRVSGTQYLWKLASNFNGGNKWGGASGWVVSSEKWWDSKDGEDVYKFVYHGNNKVTDIRTSAWNATTIYKADGTQSVTHYNTACTVYKWATSTKSDYTVTINSATGGTLTVKDYDNNTVSNGASKVKLTVLKFSASPSTGYSLSGVQIDNGSTTTTIAAADISSQTYTLTSNVTITPVWTAAKYTINYKDQGNVDFTGTHASGYPTQHTYGTETTLKTATKTGYTFGGWFTNSGCTGSAVTSLGATAYTANITLYAKWTPKTYAITLNANGGASNGSATATYNSNSVTNATYPTRDHYECTGYYTATSGGTLVLNTDGTLAKNVSGYTDANGNWIKDDAATLHARWTINQYTITYLVNSGTGTIAINLETATQSGTLTADYNTTHTLTATPAKNYRVAGWYDESDQPLQGGAEAEEVATYTITSLASDMTVKVVFAEANEELFPITASVAEGGGTVSPLSQDAGPKTKASFTAIPDPGYRFDHWTYDNTILANVVENNSAQQGEITCNTSAATSLTAHFVPVYTVKYYATPSAAGSVTATANSANVASGATHDGNTLITFTAVPNTQCNFIKWVNGAGEQLSTDQTYEHIVTQNITVKAIFTINQYTLTFTAGEGGHVSAKANNSAIASPATLDYNTSVTLTAEPSANCAFAGWYEGSTKKSSNASYTITLTADKTLEARFTKGTTIFFKPVDYWKADKARLAVYMWNSAGNKWIELEDYGCNGDIFTADIPAGYTDFKFARLRPAKADGYISNNDGLDWGNKWGDGETENLTVPTGDKNLYDMTKTYIHLKPNNNWKQASARFAAYFFGNGEKWVSMTDADGDGVYSCEQPSGFTQVILCRMKPSTTNDWNNKWNKSADQTISDGNNCFTVNDDEWGDDNTPAEGSWSKHWDACQWTTYTAPKYSITLPKTTNGTIAVTYNETTTTSKTNAEVTISNVTLNDNVTVTFTPANGYELINYLVEYANETETPGVFKICGPSEISAEFAPVATSRTIYLRPNEDWQKDYPIIAAYAYDSKNPDNDTNHKWYVMSTKPDDYTGAYSCKVENKYDCVVFVRLNQNGTQTANGGLHWDNMWNQTKGLTILDTDNDATNDKKLRFAIGAKIEGGEDDGRYNGAWEENTPIWALDADFNDWKAEKAVFKGYPGKLDIVPPFVPQHAFKLYNFFYGEGQNYFGNSGTMKRENSGQWWTMNAYEQANCHMKLDAKGEYIYQMRFLHVGEEIRKQISVTYPAEEVYALLYEYEVESQVKSRMSYNIAAVAGEKLDTVSFHVLKDANPTIKLLKNSAVLEGPISIRVKSDSVYNFVIQQSGGSASLVNAANPDVYTGKYYIRTDVAKGGWNSYKQDDNKMTYTSYADYNHNFDHYFCKWVANPKDANGNYTSYTNVKFCVANEYSHAISDELNGDEFIDKQGIAVGCLPEDGNVRFAWDSHSNEVSRAYISGSAAASDRFLVLEGNEHLKAVDGSALNISGLNPNEAIFADKQNWIYQLDVQANPLTDISLTAKYNDKVQTFFGTAKGVMQATNENYHKVRMIYDFKTNNLVAAWLLDKDQTIEAETLASNILIIRENQGTANQITFNNKAQSVQVNTAYGVMTFTQAHITDKSQSQRERSIYWISFPFDVKIDDVFGLGIGEYADQWIIQRYNGAARAEKGLFSDSGTYWEYIFDRNTVLNAGEGYVLVLDLNKIQFLHGATDVSLYFPSYNKVNTLSGTLPTEFKVPEHWCNIDREWKEGEKTYNHKFTDSHWNLIGVPALIDQTWTEAKVKQYHFMQEDVSFYYNFNLANSTYTVQSTETTFKAMYAYMVQFAGTINWITKEVTPAQKTLAARRNSDSQPEKVVLRLELTQGQEVADRTFIQLQQEGATADFDLSLDLSKIINAGSNIYTIVGEDRTPAAGNVLPFEETTVAVGVEIAAEGEYTFRMPEGTEGMVVELIDYETNTRTNLLLDDYTVTLPAGSNETRFALSMAPEKVATSIENTTTPSDSNIRKFIIDGKLYLQKDGMLYDAQGKLVR